MNVKKIGLGLLKENAWNPNFMEEREFSHLVGQIRRFGMRQPILVRPVKDFFEIVDGAHRVRASREAGLKEIDCVVVDLDETQAKSATIAMNQLRGRMDDVSLAKLIEDLKTKIGENELVDLVGIESKQITIFLKMLELPEDLSKIADSKETMESTLTFVLTESQIKVVEKALAMVDKNNKAFSLLHICKHFLNSKKN